MFVSKGKSSVKRFSPNIFPYFLPSLYVPLCKILYVMLYVPPVPFTIGTVSVTSSHTVSDTTFGRVFFSRS